MFSRPWNLRSGRSVEKHWKQAPVKSFLSSILAQSCLIVERGGMNEARRNSDPAMPRPSTVVSKKIYFLVSLPGPWMAWVNWQWIAFTLSSVVRWWSWEKKTCFFPFCYGWVCSELRRKSGCWLHISQPPRLHVFISSFTNKRSHKIVKVDSISFFLLRKLNQVFSPVIYSGCPLFLESNFFWVNTNLNFWHCKWSRLQTHTTSLFRLNVLLHSQIRSWCFYVWINIVAEDCVHIAKNNNT